MSTKPILFNSEMVRAILDGRKTQTRRPIRDMDAQHRQERGCYVEQWMMKPTGNKSEIWTDSQIFQPWNKGDILWVRETWCNTWPHDGKRCVEGPCYRATDEGECGAAIFQKWSPSIHMPKWACRLWLKVTDVRVERLLDISEADATAEGVDRGACSTLNLVGVHRSLFREAWDSIYANRGLGWETNPLVWVTEFERTDRPDGWPEVS